MGFLDLCFFDRVDGFIMVDSVMLKTMLREMVSFVQLFMDLLLLLLLDEIRKQFLLLFCFSLGEGKEGTLLFMDLLLLWLLFMAWFGFPIRSPI